uniref:Uncharacterized protein n=1 Tax=Megaselia scalaris TaxID=36166 RepID=T1GLS2_MEGSC
MELRKLWWISISRTISLVTI